LRAARNRSLLVLAIIVGLVHLIQGRRP